MQRAAKQATTAQRGGRSEKRRAKQRGFCRRQKWPPDNKGEVTGGTVSKVKINGKEVAVVGSTVTTCNDMGMQNNSVIMAAGMSIPMPAIINPKNTEEWKRDRDKEEKKNPKFTSVRWAKTSVREGEEAELTVNVQDIAEGNTVVLQVFGEGKGPEDSIAIAKFPLTVKDGSVFAKWSYRTNSKDIPPEHNPRFIFSAHSAWCPWKKSGNSLEVKLIRPEITKIEWQDAEGNSINKAVAGDAIKLYAEVTEFEEGQGVTFTVYNARTGEAVYEAGVQIQDGKAEARWNPIDTRRSDDTAELKYYFEVTAARCKAVKSGDIQVKNPKVISMEWDKKAIYWGDKATLKIKSFELSDESPVCKLQLLEKDYTTEDDFILEKEITIDKDELEQEIDFNFDIQRLRDENELELEVIPRIVVSGTLINNHGNILLVGIGGSNE